jgi:hypothetical protein
MSKLTTQARKSLKSSTFGLPGVRKYPMPDKSHAAVAKSYASKEFNAGKLSGSQKAQIDRKANSVLSDHAKNVQKAIASKRAPSPRDGHK